MFGWPMLLMPVHIVFLQVIIDPACSVVFEAEPLEADAISVPRRPDARLFDKAVLIRGLWQRVGLLVLLLAVFAWARGFSKSDDVARAMTFPVLALSNLGPIFTNRFWNEPALLACGRSNPAFIWIAATMALLAGILGVPAVSGLLSLPPRRRSCCQPRSTQHCRVCCGSRRSSGASGTEQRQRTDSQPTGISTRIAHSSNVRWRTDGLADAS